MSSLKVIKGNPGESDWLPSRGAIKEGANRGENSGGEEKRRN